MAELNKILLIGRLTKDPELRYATSGVAVATLRMAVNHTYHAKEEKKEEVLYIDVTVWGRSAEMVKQYLVKGRELFVEGRLQQDDWQDKTGQKRTTMRVTADRVQFIGGKDATVDAPVQQEPAPVATQEPELFRGKEDDLPF